jgi:hypothetical protein
VQKHALFVDGVHCMAHRINLVVQTLSFMSLVSKIETLLASMFNYFAHSQKRALDTSKLAKILHTKGNKLLKNIETH